MYVTIEPISGTPKENLDRVKLEMERVLAFRGSVSKVKVKGKMIIVEFEVNPEWDLPVDEKVKYLEEWIPAKMKVVFKVVNILPQVGFLNSP